MTRSLRDRTRSLHRLFESYILPEVRNLYQELSGSTTGRHLLIDVQGIGTTCAELAVELEGLIQAIEGESQGRTA